MYTTMATPGTPDASLTAGITSGRVKWFNNKAGYGFITVSSGEHDGTDVFVHHSAIQVATEQYRYLVQGEYVVFTLCSVENDKHQWQAGSVKGISNGKLMCETRLETRETRETRATRPSTEDGVKTPYRQRRTGQQHDDPRSTGPVDAAQSTRYQVRTRGAGPREGEEFLLVRAVSRPPSRLSSHPAKEVLRSRPVKAPYKATE